MNLRGFFSDSEVPDSFGFPSLAECGKCGLYKRCKSPKMAPTGRGKLKTLVIAQSPGRTEDEEGVQLIGASGKHLRNHLRKIGVDLEDCWKDNSVRCHPGKDEDGDVGKVTLRHVECCRPNILRTIEELKPERIILLGAEAVYSVVGHLWKDELEDTGAITRWVGWIIPSQRFNAWVCPTYHPSWLLRTPDPVKELWFARHLRRAFATEGRPWPDGPPDFLRKVERIYSAEEAAFRIRNMVKRGGMFSFDYETNMLKPDSSEARIVSCSVCRDGEEVIAFPWYGEAVKAMGEFLSSGYPKIGYNIKYETRWTKKVFGFGVRNWVWDGMVGSHVLDTRRGITSLKFQAFVLFGVNAWDTAVGHYLVAEGGKKNNKIDSCDIRDVLLYNGMDSLMEYMVGIEQMNKTGRL